MKASFDINPHVVRQLGAELVTDPVTALMELVKNAYDADAENVSVVIDKNHAYDISSDEDGYITIEDDGSGMKQDAIEKSWLIISYSQKRAEEGTGRKQRTEGGRTPLGEKGLGRLSTQRLANVCEIYTKTKDDAGIKVAFNWADFDEAVKLHDVEVDIENVEIAKPHGTKLVLKGLLDPDYWRGDNLERFKANMCQMLSPYNNQGFNVYLKVNGEDIPLRQEFTKLDQLAVSSTSFMFDGDRLRVTMRVSMRKLIGNRFSEYEKFVLPDSGKRFVDYFFDKKNKSANFRRDSNGFLLMEQDIQFSDISSLTDEKGELVSPGKFEGVIKEFSFDNRTSDSEWWKNLYTEYEEYKQFIQNQIGVKLFRNGFAIRPYGLNGEDWLMLGKGQTSGSSFYGLRPQNVIGYIAIDEGENYLLRDKTDREGLLENDCYIVFMDIIQVAIKRVNQSMEQLRRCYNDFLQENKQEKNHFATWSEAIDQVSDVSIGAKRATNELRKIQNEIVYTEKKMTAYTTSVIPFDKTTTNLLDEIKQLLEKLKLVLSQSTLLLEKAETLGEASDVLRPKMEAIMQQLEDFASLASLGLVSEMVSHDMGDVALHLSSKAEQLEYMLKQRQEIGSQELYSIANFIRSSATSLRNQMRHLDSSMRYAREKLDVFDIGMFIANEEQVFYKEKLEDSNIKLLIDVKNDFSVSANKGRLVQVLDNLINNSIYWLKKKNIVNREIRITIDKPFVYMEDNGEGIEPSFEETLFEPFVTAKQGEGRGLGLFIVRQLLETRSCDIMLEYVRNTYGRRYRFAINLSGMIK